VYSEIAANKRKTIFLIAAFVLVVATLGWLFGWLIDQPTNTPFILIAALIYALVSYFAGSRMALALNGAHEISKKDNPRLWRIVENLAITEGLPMPRVYIINDTAPNAFATGRNPNHSIVGVTTGLLDIMDDSELEGVMAHELGHIKNYDIRVSMIAFALAAVVSVIADIMLRMTFFHDDDEGGSPLFYLIGIVGAVLAPLVALFIQTAISRKREYLADATGALTTRYPEGLAQALEKISQSGGGKLHKQNASTAHLFFANPLKGKNVAHLFSTHPPLEERIRILRTMGRHE
jgi:heat shock protein HtpX